jgi:hypothetical protein
MQGRGGRTKGRQVYLGGYETEEEAARAYDKAALVHLGSSAPLNVSTQGGSCQVVDKYCPWESPLRESPLRESPLRESRRMDCSPGHAATALHPLMGTQAIQTHRSLPWQAGHPFKPCLNHSVENEPSSSQ